MRCYLFFAVISFSLLSLPRRHLFPVVISSPSLSLSRRYLFLAVISVSPSSVPRRHLGFAVIHARAGIYAVIVRPSHLYVAPFSDTKFGRPKPS
jgi:hypothetical protein